MELQVKDSSGQTGRTMVAPDSVFGREFNEPLVHQIVVAYLAGARSGSRAQKNRAQVSGGGAKPWRQKGTGPRPCRQHPQPALAGWRRYLRRAPAGSLAQG